MPPKKGGRHADPAAGAASASAAAAAAAAATTSTFEAEQFDFVSPCYWKPAEPAPATNVFGAWGGQVPKEFPSDRDVSFFGGGGAARSFDAAGVGATGGDEERAGGSGEGGDAAVAPGDDEGIDVPDHRTEREQRLQVPGSIVSRDSGSEDVAVSRLDYATLDSIPLEALFKLLTETPFNKRETMLKKEQQRRGDNEMFLDGQPVDVPSQYKTMLDRVFTRLDQLGSKENQQLELPMVRVEPLGRRTVWVNFQEIHKTLGRTAEEVKSFICNELTTTAKYVGEALHVDITRLTKEKLQKLVAEYAMSHVHCQSCHGFNTKLVRDTALRLDQVVCNACGAKRSVEGMTGGFVAIANRRARRNAKRALA